MATHEYICHCHVDMYDHGLEAKTAANPTINVEAATTEAAEAIAIDRLREQYRHEKRDVLDARVDLINQIS